MGKTRMGAMWILAIIIMVVDHVGIVMGEKYGGWLPVVMEAIGRVGLPMWGWMVATGLRRTRNIERYLWVLAMIGLMALPWRWLVTGSTWGPLQSLLLGSVIALLIEKQQNRSWWTVIAAVAVMIAMEQGYMVAMVLVVYGAMAWGGNTTDEALQSVTYLTLAQGCKAPWDCLGLVGIALIRISETVEMGSVIKKLDQVQMSKALKYSIYPVTWLMMAIFKVM